MNKKQLTVAMLSVLVVSVSLTAISSSEADAQETSQYLANEKTIAVTGTAMTSVEPDLLNVRLGIETQGKTASEALSANSEMMDKIIQSLRSIGIQESEISTSSLSIHPQYEYIHDEILKKETRQLVGYEASNIISVETKNLDLAASIIDNAVGSGANRVDSVYFSLSPEIHMTLKDQLLEKAVLNAREKAQSALAPLDYQITGVQSVSLSEFAVPYPQPVFRGSMDMSESMMMKSSTSVFSSDQDITTSAHVVFTMGSN